MIEHGGPAGVVGTTIPKMAQASAERFGDAAAIVDGDRHLSYVDVAQGMTAVARSLIAVGVVPGDRIAIWAPNCAAWITAALGIHAAGGWLVPINTRLTGAEAAYILEKTDARVLFAGDGFLDRDYVGSVRAVAPGLRALKTAVGLPLPGSTTTNRWAEFLCRGSEVAAERVQAADRCRLTGRHQRRDIHLGDNGKRPRASCSATARACMDTKCSPTDSVCGPATATSCRPRSSIVSATRPAG